MAYLAVERRKKDYLVRDVRPKWEAYTELPPWVERVFYAGPLELKSRTKMSVWNIEEVESRKNLVPQIRAYIQATGELAELLAGAATD